MLNVDINTEIVPGGSKIWAMHAGLNKKNFRSFKEKGVLYLDLPRTEINLDDNLNNGLIKQKIQRSLAWKSYVLNNKENMPNNASKEQILPNWNIDYTPTP